MAIDLVWSDEAKDDLNAVLDFIAEERPAAAVSYIAGIIESCNRLMDFPDSGRRYDDDFRCIVFRNHLVFYEHDPLRHRILIVAIVDGRRDIETLLDPGR